MLNRKNTEDLREKYGHLVDPELVEKYGDPFDLNDMRNVAPTKRREKQPDLSIEEEVKLLASDMEVLQSIVSNLAMDALQRKLGDEWMSLLDETKKPKSSKPTGTGQYL